MHSALSVLVILFVVLMATWPVAWLVAVIRHALHKRWKLVGRLGFLFPLWTIAASVGAVQIAPLLKALEAATPSPSVLVRATGLAVAVCFAALAWLLLVRSFGSPLAEDSGESASQP